MLWDLDIWHTAWWKCSKAHKIAYKLCSLFLLLFLLIISLWFFFLLQFAALFQRSCRQSSTWTMDKHWALRKGMRALWSVKQGTCQLTAVKITASCATRTGSGPHWAARHFSTVKVWANSFPFFFINQKKGWVGGIKCGEQKGLKGKMHSASGLFIRELLWFLEVDCPVLLFSALVTYYVQRGGNRSGITSIQRLP
jgi:hypothetical protein